MERAGNDAGGGKREAILQAAEKLLRERRVHELTMDEVAEAAAVPCRRWLATMEVMKTRRTGRPSTES
jgi:DNA-binding transcriptional regulator YbjK